MVAKSPASAGDAEVAVGDAVVRSGVLLVGGSGTFPVTVAFNPESGLAGYSLSIEYDPSIVNIEQLLPGDAPLPVPRCPIYLKMKDG